MKKILFALLFLEFSVSFSQSPAIQWQKRFGGSKDEIARDIKQTNDGGYIVAGCTASFTNDGDVAFNHSSFSFPNDIWITKLDSCGAMQWQKSLGGSSDDFANAIIQTRDSGYLIAGFTQSTDGDITSTHGGGSDAWIIKLDASGNMTWQKTLGGYNNDGATGIIETSDKGYMVIAWSSSNADTLGDDDYDYAFYKIDSTGALQWQKLFGGTSDDTPFDVMQGADGRYVAVGYATSNNGDVVGHTGAIGDFDCWVVTIDSSGNLLRSQCLGGSGDDRGKAILKNSDSSFAIAATTSSSDGNVASIHGGYDIWLISQDTSGNLLWQKSFGGTLDETAHSLEASGTNGFLLAGDSYSNDGDVTGNHGGSEDMWLLNLDSTGAVMWKKTLGGTQHDEPAMFLPTKEGGYVVGGTTSSVDGDVTEPQKGLSDNWIVKLSPYLPVSASSTICAGDSATLSVSGTGSYTWMPGGISGQTVHVAPNTSTTYSVYESMNACTPVFNTVYIKVNLASVITFTTLGFRDSVCYSSGAHALTGATPAGGTYSGPGVSGPDFDPSLSGLGAFTISYSYTNSNGCTSTAGHSVTVIASPTVSFTSLGFPDSICYSAGIQTLSGGAPAGGTYSGIGVSGTNFNPTTAGTGVHAVYYNYANAANCTSTASHTLMVNAVPATTFTSLGFPDSVCYDGGVQTLSGGMPAGGIYSGPGVSGSTFDPASVGVGTYTLSYHYTNSAHCSDSASHTVSVKICNTTQIASHQKSNISVYPNPAQNTCTLRGEKLLGLIKLYSAIGNCVLTSNAGGNEASLDLSLLPKGIYVLSVQNEYIRLVKD
jgi:hypothetical protein